MALNAGNVNQQFKITPSSIILYRVFDYLSLYFSAKEPLLFSFLRYNK